MELKFQSFLQFSHPFERILQKMKEFVEKQVTRLNERFSLDADTHEENEIKEIIKRSIGGGGRGRGTVHGRIR